MEVYIMGIHVVFQKTLSVSCKTPPLKFPGFMWQKSQKDYKSQR